MENRAPIFREIHKNTWLKRLLSSDSRKLSVGPKKNDRFWVVFCVHDDCQAFLEGYVEPRMAPFHNPEWTISLQNTMHISHALVGMEQDFEFVITLPNEVQRFMAPSWDCMKEWVETMRSKLREMKIISPKENVYSKLPETRQPLLPTRDPMSPLPPPPAEIPPAIVPGVEVPIPVPRLQPEPLPSTSAQSDSVISNAACVQTPLPASPTALSSVSDSDCSDSTESSSSFTQTHILPLSNTTSRSIMNLLTNPMQALTAQSQHKSTQNHQDNESLSASTVKFSLAKIFTDNVLSPFSKSPDQKLRFDFNIPPESLKFSTNITSSPLESNDNVSDVVVESATKVLKIPRPQTTKSSEKKSNSNSITTSTSTSITTTLNNNKSLPVTSVKENNVPSDSGSTNITIIQLTNTNTTDPKDASSQQTAISDSNSSISTNNNEDSFNVHIIPSSSSSNMHQTPKLITVVATDTNHQTTKVKVNAPLKSPNFSSVTNISVGGAKNAHQEYESVFFASSPVLTTQLTPSSSNSQTVDIPTAANISRHHSLGSSDINQPSSTSQQSTKVEVKSHQPPTTSSSTKIPEHLNRVLTRGLTEVSISRPSRVDRNKNLRLITATPATSTNNSLSSSAATPNSHAEMKVAIEKLKKDSHEQRRRSSSASEANSVSRGPTGHGPSNGNRHLSPTSRVVQHNIGRLTLREQQVMQLRTEMKHPGGVRLQLRRKDCLGSIAWVDAFGAVWVAGWKQKEHPMLYNALHIGDQLVSIGSVTITSAVEANKVIRSAQTLFVELIIRRVPLGRVYAIRREVEGQCLGFIRDGNTATIVDIVPNSLAARHGLPPKSKSCDGLSLTFWVLTEINGRPLNLFFKEHEVRDRLNAVGRDISILVQPSDLVTKLKKQLKSLRNHKDFIVQ